MSLGVAAILAAAPVAAQPAWLKCSVRDGGEVSETGRERWPAQVSDEQVAVRHPGPTGVTEVHVLNRYSGMLRSGCIGDCGDGMLWGPCKVATRGPRKF